MYDSFGQNKLSLGEILSPPGYTQEQLRELKNVPWGSIGIGVSGKGIKFKFLDELSL